ncbi:natural resistance-associated macrophage protein [Auriscalpium vulgare]|uniref:Natural resistance-associated macrophage protein n=1 Tax=Auriscalpium vulgare TaxID=40419 RepID=A0ACB8S2R1_9AGAM|nr:natural resistance-associated macrophage protein [Auriscalpium vulgare]
MQSSPLPDDPLDAVRATPRPAQTRRPWSERIRVTSHVVWDHVVKHTGVGVVCAVAYFDPGNWGVDLQAGSEFGYKLLFVVLLAGIFAVLLQCLASKLGIVTGLDLASHCRLLLYNRPKHTRLYRWVALYPLYALSEVAIIATDLAELLGSAIALNLLFPKLPLWAGVLLTALDVLLILALDDPLGGRPVKMFELLIAGLVISVLVCMCIIISQVHVDWGDAFHGYLPSKAIFQDGGLYVSVGIIGATVMPHSLFLGSALATQDRVSSSPMKPLAPALESSDHISITTVPHQSGIRGHIARCFESFMHQFRALDGAGEFEPRNHSERENNPLSFVRAHLNHSIADVVISLLGLAVVINSLILILASAVFYYGEAGGPRDIASLFDAHAILRDLVGQGAAITFALALLFSGQSASIVATIAGQVVSQGFLRWRVSPFLRRFITRVLGLIPSMIVAASVGRSGIDAMLVASQVALSIVLPFIVFPLVYLTSSRDVMRVRKPTAEEIAVKDNEQAGGIDVEGKGDDFVDFSNGWIVTGFGFAIWLVVVVANGYVIISLILGKGS